MSPFIQSLRGIFSRQPQSPKVIQERKDTILAIFCSTLKKIREENEAHQQGGAVTNHKGHKEMVEEAGLAVASRLHDESSPSSCRSELHDEFNPEVIQLLHLFREADTETSRTSATGDPAAVRINEEFQFEFERHNNGDIQLKELSERKSRALGEIEKNQDLFRMRNVALASYLRESIGYTVQTFQSTIPNANAGSGLFVDGEASLGSIVGFVPGEVWLKEHLGDMKTLEIFNDDPNYQLSARYDGSLVDSRPYDTPESRIPYFLPKMKNDNPWAQAHLINHPPLGSMPNCLPIMVNFGESMEDRIRSYVPNDYAKSPTIMGTIDSSFFMYGLVFVATQDVKNEELFYDYRLNPTSPPSWYHACHDELEED